MTVWTWTGAKNNDWADAANWTTSGSGTTGYPQSGDTALINSGTPDTTSVSDVAIVLGTSGTVGGILQLGGPTHPATLDSATTISGLGTSDAPVAVKAYGSATFAGRLTASGSFHVDAETSGYLELTSTASVEATTGSDLLLNMAGGTIVDDGTLAVDNGGTMVVEGMSPLSGNGSLQITGIAILSGVSLGAGIAVIGSGGTASAPAALQADGAVTLSGSLTAAGGTFHLDSENGASLTLASGATVTATSGAGFLLNMSSGPVTNNGTLVVNGGSVLTVAGTQTLTGGGTIQIGEGGTADLIAGVNQAVLYEAPDATLDLQNALTFSGSVGNMIAGDVLDLGHVSASYSGTTLTVVSSSVNGSATNAFELRADGTAGTRVITAVGGESFVVASDVTRTFTGGGSGDWYDPASWGDAGRPLAGDTVSIGSGTASITAADVASHGGIDLETIVLGSYSHTSAGLQASAGQFGGDVLIQTQGDSTSGGTPGAQTLTFDGATSFGGQIVAAARNETLTVQVGTAGDGSTLSISRIPGDADPLVLASQESGIVFSGGTVTNDGLILAEGGVTFSTALNGTGTVATQQGGTVDVAGPVSGGEAFYLTDGTGTLSLDAPSTFGGVVQFGASGDRVVLPGVASSDVKYGSGGFVVSGSSVISASNGDASDFAISNITYNGGSATEIVYTPQGSVILGETLPVPFAGSATATTTLPALLDSAFGSNAVFYSSYILQWASASTLSADDFSYWNLSSPAVANWTSSGAQLPTSTNVPNGGMASVSLVGGNAIGPFATITVPTGLASGSTEKTEYYVYTVDPTLVSTSATTSIPTPQSILDSVSAHEQLYGQNQIYNTFDCGYIAGSVAEAAGAAFPNESLISAEQPGGFWRVVYDGAQEPDPTTDWWQYLQPGDIVKIGWLGTPGSHHTTTIIGNATSSGVMVYDNGGDYIGEHEAAYWLAANPADVTILRLTSQQYLISGTPNAEIIQGTTYPNLIIPGGGADRITAGAADNEIQGTAAQLDGITITDFHVGDYLDFTDLDPSNTTVTFDSSDHMAQVMEGGATVATVTLSADFDGAFMTAADGSGGTEVTGVACYCRGTLIATPSGERLVEDLTAGDLVVTASGDPRTIRWIGRRSYAGRFLSGNPAVQPIRFRAGSLGGGRPRRDLLVSPEHAMFLDGLLIPARHLVNGLGIVPQTGLRQVDYFHVELDRHDLLLAEGVPAESFFDDDSRGLFHNTHERQVRELAQAKAVSRPFAPRVVDGEALESIRRRVRSLMSERAA